MTVNKKASEAGKQLASLRKPKNMRRGDSDYYRQLALIRHGKKGAKK